MEIQPSNSKRTACRSRTHRDDNFSPLLTPSCLSSALRWSPRRKLWIWCEGQHVRRRCRISLYDCEKSASRSLARRFAPEMVQMRKVREILFYKRESQEHFSPSAGDPDRVRDLQ